MWHWPPATPRGRGKGVGQYHVEAQRCQRADRFTHGCAIRLCHPILPGAVHRYQRIADEQKTPVLVLPQVRKRAARMARRGDQFKVRRKLSPPQRQRRIDHYALLFQYRSFHVAATNWRAQLALPTPPYVPVRDGGRQEIPVSHRPVHESRPARESRRPWSQKECYRRRALADRYKACSDRGIRA